MESLIERVEGNLEAWSVPLQRSRRGRTWLAACAPGREMRRMPFQKKRREEVRLVKLSAPSEETQDVNLSNERRDHLGEIVTKLMTRECV